MTITKYLHSCLYLEKSGKRLLFDPGLFSFIEGRLTPQDIGPVDVIVFAKKIKPHTVIPIHDAFVKDFALQRLYPMMYAPLLAEAGISLQMLELGQGVEVTQ